MATPTQPSVSHLAEAQRNAEQFLQAGEAQKAVDSLDRISEELSSYPVLYRLKGIARLLQGNNTEAKLIFDELESTFGDDPSFLNVYGVSLRRERDLGKAKEVYGRALELDPDQPALLSNFGNLLIDLGQLDKAREYLDRAIVLDPNHQDAKQNLARLERCCGAGSTDSLGTSRASTKHTGQSQSTKPYKIDQEAASDWLKLAASAQREGNVEEAIVFARRAIDAQTDCAGAYKLAGEVMAGLGRWDQAEQALLYGALLGEVDANTLSNLGGICATRGQYALARLLLQRVLRKEPEHTAAKTNLERLNKIAENPSKSNQPLF